MEELSNVLEEFGHNIDEKELCNYMLFSYSICKIKRVPSALIVGQRELDYVTNWRAKTQDDAKLLRKIGIFYHFYKKIPPPDFIKWAKKNQARVAELAKIGDIFGLGQPAIFTLILNAANYK